MAKPGLLLQLRRRALNQGLSRLFNGRLLQDQNAGHQLLFGGGSLRLGDCGQEHQCQQGYFFHVFGLWFGIKPVL